jgi:hypothetical protein
VLDPKWLIALGGHVPRRGHRIADLTRGQLELAGKGWHLIDFRSLTDSRGLPIQKMLPPREPLRIGWDWELQPHYLPFPIDPLWLPGCFPGDNRDIGMVAQFR